MRVHFLYIGHPEHKRWQLFQQALAACGLPPASCLSYLALLEGRMQLPSDPDLVVRIDSPGQNSAVERALIAAGAEEPDEAQPQAARISARAARALPDERGHLRYPRQWYRGYRALLRRLGHCPASFMTHPAEIIALFDKPRCHQRCAAAGLPVPPILGRFPGYEALRAALIEQGWGRLFIKLACGSSAAGIVAYGIDRHGQEYAFTTLEHVQARGSSRFYNSRRVRRLSHWRQIAPCIDFLCREGAQVERWLPKAALQGRPFDLRVLVVGGQAAHAVVRLGRSPMTNLHLGNQRGDLEALRAQLGVARWRAIRRACERAAACFPAAFHCGVDLLLAPGLDEHAILELNAFGDLLPNLSWQGYSTHEWELRCWLQREATHA